MLFLEFAVRIVLFMVLASVIIGAFGALYEGVHKYLETRRRNREAREGREFLESWMRNRQNRELTEQYFKKIEEYRRDFA